MDMNTDEMADGDESASDESPQTTIHHLGPRKFTLDFLKTKNTDYDTMFNKFTSLNKKTRINILKEVEPICMSTTFNLWEAIKKKDPNASTSQSRTQKQGRS